MKQFAVLLLSLLFLHASSLCQSRFQVLLSGGPTFTPEIKYQNSTGHINTAATAALSLIYHPVSALGIELKYGGLVSPLSYLNHETDASVKAYTISPLLFNGC